MTRIRNILLAATTLAAVVLVMDLSSAAGATGVHILYDDLDNGYYPSQSGSAGETGSHDGSGGHNNNGHGNNEDGVDSSNPSQGHGGPNGAVDESCPAGGTCVDDESSGGHS